MFAEVKIRLRQKNLSARKSQNPQEKKENDQQIVKKIIRLKSFKKAKKILFYLPIHGEVDLTGLFKKFGEGKIAKNHKKTFILPRIKGKQLQLHSIEHLHQTAKGKFNIMEPHQHLPQTKPEELDLILVPGVVFSEDGHRIGYGKGFYDRYLAKCRPEVLKIGFSYFEPVQAIDDLNAFDIPLNFCITTEAVYEF